MSEPSSLASRLLAAFGVVLLLMVSPAAATTVATPGAYPRVPAYEPKYTAIVMDARTGEILYSERGDSPRYPASVTKVMTMYLAFDALAAGRMKLTDQIVVSPHAAAQPATKLGLRAGATITVENALYAMAVHSCNDMAVAMAEHIGGTESRFAEMMTLKAQQLGMTNTRYVNANGLPDSRQISSAHDLAVLSRAVLHDFPQYYRFFSQEQFTYAGRTMYNTNHLLGKMPGVDGLKTGFTNAAGFNLAASAMRNGNRLIAVVMGGSSGSVRNANVEGLLLTGFDVMERRARGERMAATQSYFQSGQSYPAVPGAAGRGEDSEDAIDVVLTRAAGRPGPMTVSSTMAGATGQAAVAPAARPLPNWWVRLGQFRSRSQARVGVERASPRLAGVIDLARLAITGRRRDYHAEIAGLTEAAAHDACARARGARLACVAGPA